MAGEMNRFAQEQAYRSLEREALGRTKEQEEPKAVILGGQPGSGKSGLRGDAAVEMRKDGGAVVIDADRMREANPEYKRLSIEDPQNAADRTHKEAAEWATRLTVAAVEARRNVIIDGTMRDPANVRERTEMLKEAGYQVDVRVIAMNPETSMTRARLRYEEQVAERGVGRFVNDKQHDEAYAGIPKSMELVEREKLADKITVYDAKREPVYSNAVENGEWKRAPEAAKALEAERARELTHFELRDRAEVLTDIAALAKERTGQPDKAIEVRVGKAIEDLERSRSSPAFQRGEAFNSMTSREALAKHPELDGAYAQLRDVRQEHASSSQDERERAYFAARSELTNKIYGGEIPKGSVSVEESARVINVAAKAQGISSVRDAADVGRDVKGEVTAVSSHHALVRIGDGVAVRVERGNLDREVQAGEQVSIAYGKEQSQVRDTTRGASQDAQKEPGRDMGGR